MNFFTIFAPIGKMVLEGNLDEEQDNNSVPIVPPNHRLTATPIEITISQDGNFVNASNIPDKEKVIIPVTEDSDARSSGISPFPLFDHIKYVAGDLAAYTTEKTEKQKEKLRRHHDAYMEQLSAWIDSPYSHEALLPIKTYLEKDMVVHDLIKSEVVKPGKIDPNIMVRFRVEYDDLDKRSDIWNDRSLQMAHIRHMNNFGKEKRIDFISGEMCVPMRKHPGKIIPKKPNAKLVSCNDVNETVFTGRFPNIDHLPYISAETANYAYCGCDYIKRHNGIFIGDMVLAVFNGDLSPTPKITASSDELMADDEDDVFAGVQEEKSVPKYSSIPAYRDELKKAIWQNKLPGDVKDKTYIAIIDAVSKGHSSQNRCEEYSTSEIYNNILSWHMQTTYGYYNPKLKTRAFRSPSLYEIINNAYGVEMKENGQLKVMLASDSYRKNLMKRLVRCVIYNEKLPKEFLDNICYKATRPTAYSERRNWLRVLGTACSLIRKNMIDNNLIDEMEDATMSLDVENRDRSYLFGRLLAIADVAEYSVAKDPTGKRKTNALKYMNQCTLTPSLTWGRIHSKLIPYFEKMENGKSGYYQREISNVMSLFENDDYKRKGRLTPMFLLGYYCQRNTMFTKKGEK